MTLFDLIVTAATVAALLLAWLLVQRAWQRSFPDRAGEDALERQFRCGDCCCGAICERSGASGAATPTEEARP